ncbi:unnamed protein product [Blepharisma stoltei]|uniref:Uncharacterized protein n=1 Tax=Blepharisma stoltei TaxID=1481888 RepID=A0AAU9IUN6_9CILI|nr:unnamed protein product [Blepharisma stoltei]
MFKNPFNWWKRRVVPCNTPVFASESPSNSSLRASHEYVNINFDSSIRDRDRTALVDDLSSLEKLSFLPLPNGKSVNSYSKFDLNNFSLNFNNMLNDIGKLPIEYFDVILYDFCRETLNKDLDKNCIKLIKKLHHIYRLQSSAMDLKEAEAVLLNENLQVITEKNPNAINDYNLVKEALKILSSIAIKWGFIRIEDYLYRLVGNGANVCMLDLKEINSEIFSAESIWLAINLPKEPLCNLADDQLMQNSQTLISQLPELIGALVALNKDCDFSTTPSIAGLVASKNSEVEVLTGISPDYNANIVDYAQLKLKHGVFKCFNKNKFRDAVNNLYKKLKEFESVFRHFEYGLISNLVTITQNNET